jgi:hypothetical protein
MSSSGILSVNSGPLIIRTYLDGSSNNSYVLGNYDIPVASGLVLTTSTNGLVVPSNNITISSITVSSIFASSIFASTLSSNTINTSSLIVSSINGVVPISSGTYYGDYLFWNSNSTIWQVGNSTINIGSFAGSTIGNESIAIGYYAASSSPDNEGSIAIGKYTGTYDQDITSIAIGYYTGNISQGRNSIALGTEAGFDNQKDYSIAIGYQTAMSTQDSYSIAIGFQAAISSQSTNSIAIGTSAGSCNQDAYSIAIGPSAGATSQSSFCIAIGNNAGKTGQLIKAIAIGNCAAQTNQSGSAIAIGDFSAQVNQGIGGIAIGTVAGTNNQSTNSIAIGTSAAQFNQHDSAVALGNYAGNYYQSTNAIAIGTYAGSTSQGINSIAIGTYAGALNQSSNTIILNASGVNVSSFVSSSFYVNPVRFDSNTTNVLRYNIDTSEITYSAKTFVIQHPSKQDNYLVHACLEGPESGIYYRGTAIVLGKFVEIELPEYVMALANSFTVNVTHVYDEVNDTECKSYSATRVKNGRFRIYGECGTVDWVVFGKRADIEVEPLKTSVDIKGSGPYRWL